MFEDSRWGPQDYFTTGVRTGGAGTGGPAKLGTLNGHAMPCAMPQLRRDFSADDSPGHTGGADHTSQDPRHLGIPGRIFGRVVESLGTRR